MKYVVMSATHNAPIATFDNEHDAINAMNSYNWSNDTDTAYIENKEDTTMTINTENATTTFELNNTTYTHHVATGRFSKTVDGKTTRIGKTEYEAAKAQAEQTKLDAEPCVIRMDPTGTDLQTPATMDQFGGVDCSKCNVQNCPHRDCMRRNPREVGGLAECPRLSVEAEEDEVVDTEIEEIKQEIPGIETAEAELENNIRKEKKAKKARRSKDIAYEMRESHATEPVLTLTAKQVDFIRHLSDTCFWENGLDSGIWVDVLCDEIGGQFAGKPMTVGAMISTLCEKGLGVRTKDRVNGRKAIGFYLTDLGKTVAKDLGLE